MRIARQAVRFTGFCGLIASYGAAAVATQILYTDIWERRHRLARVVGFHSALALRLFGFKIVHAGNLDKPDTALIVANHLSYLDVLIMAATRPVVFVTSVEIRDTPFLGQLSQLAGCLYVERRNRERLHLEVQEVTEGLKKGLNVCVFPEATSTNGETVLRFRRPLFRAALEGRQPVAPITINYRRLSGTPVTARNRDTVAWYGEMSFLPHLWKMLGEKTIEVELHAGQPLTAHLEDWSNFASPENHAAQALSEVAHSRVSARFVPLH